jgi:hypothetical protein
MNTLKIAFTDFWPEWKDEDFITPILQKKFNVVIDQDNPDVLFHSIFGGVKNAPSYKCKKILFLGENWNPKQFNSNYSISFEPHSRTNFRLPLWEVYLLLWPNLKEKLFNRKKWKNFERFCSFTVSNPSNQFRNIAFDNLSLYKRIHSYGKVRMNDLGLNQLSRGKYWRYGKNQFFLDHSHKFMIAYENNGYPYYCTEKLMDAFLAGSMPIYWGDPKVKEDWNEKAFLNVVDYPEWIHEVKKLDQNEEYFNEKYNEPVFTGEQKDKLINNLDKFEMWLLNKVKE